MKGPVRMAYEVDATLIAKFRTPLDGKTATILAATVIEHPDHVVSVEGDDVRWLVLRHPLGGVA